MRLKGKFALVTGAARGNGKAIALSFAEEGANVLVNDIDLELAAKLAKDIKDLGRQALAVKANVSKTADVEKMVAEALREFGRIDILVNNAGIFRKAFAVEMTDEQWDETIRVDLKGVFNCCRAVIAPMTRHNYGRIVNISSIDGLRGCSGYAHYAAAKAGVIGLTRSLARELAPYGICVNAVAPGMIDTDMTKDRIAKYKHDYEKQIPLGRIGKPKDVAGAVTFLASDEASYMTGQTINVDGGWVMT
jgi:3-oxoacyl-[acyl-carrier protein] reductase